MATGTKEGRVAKLVKQFEVNGDGMPPGGMPGANQPNDGEDKDRPVVTTEQEDSPPLAHGEEDAARENVEDVRDKMRELERRLDSMHQRMDANELADLRARVRAMERDATRGAFAMVAQAMKHAESRMKMREKVMRERRARKEAEGVARKMAWVAQVERARQKRHAEKMRQVDAQQQAQLEAMKQAQLEAEIQAEIEARRRERAEAEVAEAEAELRRLEEAKRRSEQQQQAELEAQRWKAWRLSMVRARNEAEAELKRVEAKAQAEEEEEDEDKGGKARKIGRSKDEQRVKWRDSKGDFFKTLPMVNGKRKLRRVYVNTPEGKVLDGKKK